MGEGMNTPGAKDLGATSQNLPTMQTKIWKDTQNLEAAAETKGRQDHPFISWQSKD